MASFFCARDPVSGALLATLPCTMLKDETASPAGLSRRLRSLFVAAGRLNPEEAERVDFERRETPSRDAETPRLAPL